MKKSKRYLTLLFTLIVWISSAANITEEEAQVTACNFLYGHEQDIINIKTYGEEGGAQMYIINFNPVGWAIVSSDKETRPVIAYSYEGSFDTEDLNLNIQDWLTNQIMQIKNKDKRKDWSEEWKTLETGKLPILKSASIVEPLLKTKWDQGKGWNDLCPYYAEGPNQKAYIGCVAVAMAQSLHNISYPDRPVDSKSYALAPYGTIYTDFDNEAPYEWDKMGLTSSDDYNRQLLYNCAVAVEMDFGGDGSGAYTTRVPFAFRKYFQMDDQVKCLSRSDYTEDEWIDILKEQLQAGRVLIYSGNPSGGGTGHAFNIDGYNAAGYFHFNWGWSGSYNGYFSINDVAPGNSDFTGNQKTVVGIGTPYSGPTDIMLSNTSISKDASIGSVIGAITVDDISENETFEFEVFEKDFLSLKTSKNFEVVNSELKTKSTLSSSVSSYSITLRVTDSEELSLDKEFTIITNNNASAISDASENTLNIYPNPATSILNIANADKIEKIMLIDLAGKATYIKSDLTTNSIDVSQIKRGMYILKITDKNKHTSLERLILK